MVMRMLDVSKTNGNVPGTIAHPSVPLKGVVGRALSALGLNVGMNVYEDQFFYDVVTEIVVTNPDRPERGQVRVTDDGVIRWEYDYQDMIGSDARAMAHAILAVLVETIATCEPHMKNYDVLA